MRRKRTRRQGRLWQQREARALEMMRFKQYASVLDIGRAAVRGESEAFAISLDGFGNIGRTVAESLMQAGVARKVAGDLFTLKPEPSRSSYTLGRHSALPRMRCSDGRRKRRLAEMQRRLWMLGKG